jgi:oligoendopeptidase F
VCEPAIGKISGSSGLRSGRFLCLLARQLSKVVSQFPSSLPPIADRDNNAGATYNECEMRTVAFLLLILAVGAGGPAYQIDLGRYFPSATAEQAQRQELLRNVDAFDRLSASSLNSPKALLDWIRRRDELSRSLRKHDIYVYLRAEEDVNDRTDAAADTALSEAMDQLDNVTKNTIAALSPATLTGFLAPDTALAPYRYFVESALRQAKHANQNQRAVALLAQPALTSLGDAYKSLRRQAQPLPTSAPTGREQRFDSEWSPFANNESSFASLLIPIVQLQNGKAQLQGFNSAPAAAYFSRDLTLDEVNSVLAAVRRSDGNKQYEMVVAATAARQLQMPLADIHPWELAAADTYYPSPTAFQDSVRLILAAEAPMGTEYSGQFERLFDPANHRVELCESDNCDHTGFSVGFVGSTSGLFFGSYRGSTDNIRAVAHEAGHAVHREFMNENQPIAVYNSGPHFVFESFAIFNEFLLLDHLYQTAATPAAKAYYLHQFLDDATFQVYGSAREADLEQSIYAGVQDGTLRDAADLDALTLKVFSEYVPTPALSPQMRVYWARDRLYFTDPLYDVNYLFAGLLALQYLKQFADDPQGFSRRYVTLLKNGFTESPQTLEKQFLNINLNDADHLVGDASALIKKRTSILESLYHE